MWFKREDERPEVDEVIDLTERLAPYEGESATVVAWRNGLKAADRELYRTSRRTRNKPVPAVHFRTRP